MNAMHSTCIDLTFLLLSFDGNEERAVLSVVRSLFVGMFLFGIKSYV